MKNALEFEHTLNEMLDFCNENNIQIFIAWKPAGKGFSSAHNHRADASPGNGELHDVAKMVMESNEPYSSPWAKVNG